MRKKTFVLTPLALALGVVLLCSSPQIGAQEPGRSDKKVQQKTRTTGEWFDPQFGRAAASIAEFTDVGNWDGTWFYANRDSQIMIWMRTVGGKPQCRIKYFSLGSAEQFLTDWNGFAEYESNGNPGKYSFALKQGDPKQIVADWDWVVQFSNSSRHENAEVTIRRSGDGRRMIWLFEPLVREIDRFGTVTRTEISQALTFTKVSKRHILWDELF